MILQLVGIFNADESRMSKTTSPKYISISVVAVETRSRDLSSVLVFPSNGVFTNIQKDSASTGDDGVVLVLSAILGPIVFIGIASFLVIVVLIVVAAYRRKAKSTTGR